MVYPGLDLHGPEDDARLGESVDDQLAIVRRVVARGHPGDHVVPTGRSHWQHEHKLGRGALGQPHRHVVGLDLHCLPAEQLARDRPNILLVVEDLWVAHVKRGIDLRLELEQVHGIAQVSGKGWRHLRRRPEQIREDRGQGAGDRLVRDHLVEGHSAVVGVHHDLDAVAHVVDVAVPCRVRVAVGRGVGVHYPEEPAVGEHQVGIAVVAEERRDPSHAGGDLTGEEQPAVPADVGGQQQLGVPKPVGQGQARQVAEPDPSLPGIVRIYVLVPARVVQLANLGVYDHVVRGQLTEVDLRPRNLHTRDRLGWDVL